MEDTRVTFETAKLAKEKGFPQETDRLEIPYYNYKGEFKGDISDWRIRKYIRGEDTSDIEFVSAPTQSLLAKWLRKEHGIYIELLIDGWSDDDCVTDDFLCYRCFIWQVGKPRPKHNEDLGAGEYEKMFEIGLQEALKLI